MNVSVFRYDPSEDSTPSFEINEVPHRERMTVLEVLKYIYDNDTPIAFRYSYSIKACDSSAIKMNQKPVLTCKGKAQPVMTLEPLRVLPVVKDLVIDFDVYTEQRAKSRSFVEHLQGPPPLFPKNPLSTIPTLIPSSSAVKTSARKGLTCVLGK